MHFFEGRDQFDLVVYFDQSTPSADFLSGRAPLNNPPLKYLHDALYHFNQERPLKWPPSLLRGGLNAWIHLLGEDALKRSRTAHRQKTPTSHPISRKAPANAQARINIQKRRHREYNPLGEDEERKWRDRARSESIVLDSQPRPEESEAESVDGDSIDTWPIDESRRGTRPTVSNI